MTDTAIKRRPFLLSAGAAGLMAAGSTAAWAQSRNPTGLGVPLSGLANGAEVVGTFSPAVAVVQNNALFLQGLLRLSTGATRQVLMPVTPTMPASAAAPAGAAAQAALCGTILDLSLGPLDLNLLGLMVHLDEVNLRITAQPGGGLLGDLLCSLSGLLSGGGTLLAIANVLNQILALFR